MKKTRKTHGCLLISIIAVLAVMSFISSAVMTVNDNGVKLSTFSDADTVYVKSDPGLCNNAYEVVDLYVVESGTDDLSDSEPMTINLSDNKAISFTEIMNEPAIGDYDVLIDCDMNGEYSPLEPMTSFIVKTDQGSGSVIRGENDIGNHSWRFDPEDEDLGNVMLQLELSAGEEDINLRNITIMMETSEQSTNIRKVEVYSDDDGDGKVGDDEDMIGDFELESPVSNGGKITFALDDAVVPTDESINILVVYQMSEEVESGSYYLVVQSLMGRGDDSNKVISFTGLPIKSGTKSAAPKKSCLGDLSIELSPNPAQIGDDVSVIMSGLEGCTNRRISVRTTPCDASLGEEVGFCIVGDSGCQVTVPADDETFYACIDKNSDGDLEDVGESASETLVISEDVTVDVAPEEEMTETVVEDEPSEVEVTGAATGIEGLSGNLLGAAGGFLILLEITLLLILFVLVMILFKLKGPGEEDEEE